MEAIKEIFASIRFQLSERLGNPLTGAFILAWCLINFRLFVVVFGEGEWPAKIEYIDKTLYPSSSVWASRTGWALLSAALYVFAYPFVAIWVIKFHRTRQKKLRELAISIEGETPITKEEKAALILRMKNSEQKAKKQIEELQTENSDLTQALEHAQAELTRLKPSTVEEEEEDGETFDELLPSKEHLAASSINNIGSEKIGEALGPATLIPVDTAKLQLGSAAHRITLSKTGVTLQMLRCLELFENRGDRFSEDEITRGMNIGVGDTKVLIGQMNHLGLLDKQLHVDRYRVSTLGLEVLKQARDRFGPTLLRYSSASAS